MTSISPTEHRVLYRSISAEGETLAAVFYRAKPHPLAPKLEPDSHGLTYLPDEAFATAFAPNASAEELALLPAVQRPISPACITVPVDPPLRREEPTWFLIAAEQDRLIVHDTAHNMAKRMKDRLRSLPVDKAPIVTALTSSSTSYARPL